MEPDLLSKWRSFPIQRQGPQDYACIASCIASAAVHLGVQDNDGGAVARILGIAAEQFSHQPLTTGVSEWKVRALALAAGLRLLRLQPATIDLICQPRNRECESSVWVALVRMDFVYLGKMLTSTDLHYVLVLEGNARRVVVVDPHPWHPAVQEMATGDFEEAWTGARGAGKPRWLGLLSASH